MSFSPNSAWYFTERDVVLSLSHSQLQCSVQATINWHNGALLGCVRCVEELYWLWFRVHLAAGPAAKEWWTRPCLMFQTLSLCMCCSSHMGLMYDHIFLPLIFGILSVTVHAFHVPKTYRWFLQRGLNIWDPKQYGFCMLPEKRIKKHRQWKTLPTSIKEKETL